MSEKKDIKSSLPPIRKRGVIERWLEVMLRIALFPFQFILVWFQSTESLSPTMRHSYFVARLKIFMVSLSVALILGLIIWPMTDFGQVKMKFESADASEVGEQQVKMQKPRFYGVDEKSQPYSVLADEAIQLDEDTIKLTTVKSEISLDNGDKFTLSSNHGAYNLESQKILLNGNIHVVIQQGYHLFTDILQVNIKESYANGEKKVRIKGPLGNLVANQFEIKQGGEVLHFNGEIKLVAYPFEGEDKANE